MQTISTSELAKRTAGGDSYIRTKNGKVMGLAITSEKNPEAPEIIVVGTGPRIIKNAELLVDCGEFVPVYLKQAVDSWKLLGMYKAEQYNKSKQKIEKHKKHRPENSISGILFLRSEDDIDVDVSSPTYFPDVATKKKIELAAIETVKSHFEENGYTVFDHQKKNCGYDLAVQKQKQILKIEVKGTSMVQQRFFLSRKERAKSVDPLWRLAIVTNALDEPVLEILSTNEMEKRFNFDSLCWECTPTKT